MQIVYTVPFRIHPVLAWILRICALLLCIGALVFTVIGLIRAQRNVHRPEHRTPHVAPIIRPYR